MKFDFLKTNPWPNTQPADWNSWLWQLRHSAKSEADFSRYLQLSPNESEAFSKSEGIFNIRATPYYLRLVGESEFDPIRKILVPSSAELNSGKQQMSDPLGERRNNPAPRIVHRYSDRVLFLVTDICSVYCRYCTRKYFTGQEQAQVRSDDYQHALLYISSHKGIREVILSGGDPLTLSDENLLRIVHDLRKIEHVEIIRIGSRMPVVCPMRISEEFVQELKRYKPVYLMTHFNHPRELTAEAATALELFVDKGVPVFNQMVLLNGVNNHAAIVQALSRRLLYLRVKPHYIFQCDPSMGTDHLRTTIEDSEEIQRELWGHLSGLAVPTFSLDIPNGGGKVSLTPQFEVSRTAESRSYRGWDGVESSYINVETQRLLKPLDVEMYYAEWESLRSAKKQSN